MSTASRTFTCNSVRPAMSWWSNIADGTWGKIACGPTAPGVSANQRGNRIFEAWADPFQSNGTATADGGQPNIFSYSGGCVDQSRGEFWIVGGGHRAHPGNEPYRLKIFADAPGWEAACSPSPGSYVVQGNSQNGPSQYVQDIGINGAPQSSHTYHRLCFANDKVWLPGLGGQQWDPVYTSSRIFSFDRARAKWSAHGWAIRDSEYSPYSHPTEEASALYYPNDDVILASFKGGPEGAMHTAAISPYTGAVIERYPYVYPTSYGMQQSCAKLITGTSHVLLVSSNYFLSGQNGGVFLWSAANPAANPTRLTITDNTGGMPWLEYVVGMVWDENSGAFFIQRNFGETFVKLAPNSAGNYSGGWTASVVTPTNVASPSRVIPPVLGWADPRPYSRWNIIQDMGDGRAAIVWQPDTPLQPTFVFAIPASGL